uniref:FAD_binding_2 domain-containing protein n=1 Tax=Angiostrongylus costaricensis TaxID=334426 RepID=A0A0R3PF52_ANGCS
MCNGTLFENYVTASTFRSIQTSFYQLCLALDIDPSDSINVYPKLRLLDYWKAQKLWKLLDRKWELPVYKNQNAGRLLNVFVIGAGPCGLRSAIECALLGSRVVLVEQRDRFSRNNVLHLWEFVIQDLKSLGAKIFYPKFCTGSIEHISIRQLQCILLKVALCFGVQVYDSVTFVQILFPKNEDNIGKFFLHLLHANYFSVEDSTEMSGFRACLEPKGHILSEYDIDVLIGADGKRNTLPGEHLSLSHDTVGYDQRRYSNYATKPVLFMRVIQSCTGIVWEMRGKLAIGITANFINNKTAAEERVPEISGVAYIFNQTFFKEMYDETGVDLENIVYYKDDTHYFVMCAKKHSLLDKGVIRKDNDDVSQLLSIRNIDQEALCRYARAAANFATNAMFDFTSLYSSKCSVRLVERLNKYLLMGVVGDSLHEVSSCM